MTINIYQLPPGSDFNPCGCGGTSGGAGGGEKIPTSGGGVMLPGGTEGGAIYDGQARVIDICANVQTIFADAIGDYINTVQSLQYVPVAAQYDEFAEQLGAVSIEDFTQLEAELFSPESISAFKTWVAKHFDDPFGGFESRWQLRRQIFGKTPLTINGALFQPILLAWADTANIQALNKRISDVSGTASYTGECAALQRGFGREPYQPPNLSGDGVIVLDSDAYRFTRIINEEGMLNDNRTWNFSGTDFVGYLYRITTTDAGGTGTAVLHSANVAHTQGATNDSGSVGSGNTPGVTRPNRGIANLGTLAGNQAPLYLNDFVGVDFPQDPSGATFPAVGAFTGDVSVSNALDTISTVQVWIVTSLDGSASLD